MDKERISTKLVLLNIELLATTVFVIWYTCKFGFSWALSPFYILLPANYLILLFLKFRKLKNRHK